MLDAVEFLQATGLWYGESLIQISASHRPRGLTKAARWRLSHMSPDIRAKYRKRVTKLVKRTLTHDDAQSILESCARLPEPRKFWEVWDTLIWCPRLWHKFNNLIRCIFFGRRKCAKYTTGQLEAALRKSGRHTYRRRKPSEQ